MHDDKDGFLAFTRALSSKISDQNLRDGLPAEVKKYLTIDKKNEEDDL